MNVYSMGVLLLVVVLVVDFHDDDVFVVFSPRIERARENLQWRFQDIGGEGEGKTTIQQTQNNIKIFPSLKLWKEEKKDDRYANQ